MFRALTMTPTLRFFALAAAVNVALPVALTVAAGSAVAGDLETLRLRSLAASCAQCHGTDGRGVEGSAIPALAGVPAAQIGTQMKAYASGARAGTVMPQIAKGYSDAQIDALARWFAAAGGAGPR